MPNIDRVIITHPDSGMQQVALIVGDGNYKFADGTVVDTPKALALGLSIPSDQR